MKILISGSRTANDKMLAYAYRCVERAKSGGHQIIVGDASGIDAWVIGACEKLDVPCVVYGAKNRHRNKAKHKAGANISLDCNYYQRDMVMVDRADFIMVIWNGKSRGSKTVFQSAIKAGKKAHLQKYP